MPTPQIVSPADVRVHRDRLLASRFFRGLKLKQLLRLLVEEYLADGGKKLTERYIGEATGESLTFEENSSKWGYPKTRGNLGHVRTRLRIFHETEGYRDPVIIKLNAGSYIPVIAINPVCMSAPDLEPEVARLILRARTALDSRSIPGTVRACRYARQILLAADNARHAAHFVFIDMMAAVVLPVAALEARPLIDPLRAQIRASGVEPWEWTFSDACALVYRFIKI